MHAYLRQSSGHFPVAIPAFGNWIHRRRLEVGLSRARAAALTGLSHRDWSMLEQGWVPSFDERLLRSIAGTLEVTFDALDCAIEPLRTHFAGAQECPWNS
jgi:transcriptional regulator with XRE-family HTH domain